MSAIPARAGPLRTDGALLLSLFRGGEDMKLTMAQLRVLGMHMHGVRARDWDARSAALLEPSASAQPLALMSALILYEWNLDRGESAVAGEWIDRARVTPEAQSRSSRGNVLAESAYFEAFYRHNPQQARQWLEEAGSDWTLETFVRSRADAAVLLSEGRRIEAAEACDQALATLRREFPSGRLPATEQDWISEIRARAIDSG